MLLFGETPHAPSSLPEVALRLTLTVCACCRRSDFSLPGTPSMGWFLMSVPCPIVFCVWRHSAFETADDSNRVRPLFSHLPAALPRACEHRSELTPPLLTCSLPCVSKTVSLPPRASFFPGRKAPREVSPPGLGWCSMPAVEARLVGVATRFKKIQENLREPAFSHF